MGWSFRPDNSFSFGGYGCTPDESFLRVILAMRDAQLDCFMKTLPKIGRELLHKFENDLVGFSKDMSYASSDTGYYYTPILHHLDERKFAQLIVQHLRFGRFETLGKAIELIAERQNYSGDWIKEMRWFGAVKEILLKKVSRRSNHARAQLNCFLKFHWKFKSEQEG